MDDGEWNKLSESNDLIDELSDEELDRPEDNEGFTNCNRFCLAGSQSASATRCNLAQRLWDNV